MAAFLEVENLTKRFGGLIAVNNVSFQIGRDEIVGLRHQPRSFREDA